MRRREAAPAAVCVAFFAWMFREATALRGAGRAGEMGSAFWPLLALGGCLVLSVIWLGSALVSREAAPGPTGPATAETVEAAWARRRTVGASVLTLGAYILVMPWIGFLLSTLAFVLAFAAGLGERRRWVLGASPIVVTGVIALIFAWFIAIPLPRGVGPFAALSRLFY